MSEECSKHKIADGFGLFVGEYEDAEGWPLTFMLVQDLLKQFEAVLGHHLSFDHGVKHKVHNSQKRAYFLVGVGIRCAKVIIDIVKIQNKLVYSINFISW